MSGFIDMTPLIRGMQAAGRAQVEAARQGMNEFAEHVAGDGQELAPVETGALKASATTEDAKVEGSKITCVLGFNTSYAAAVHERLDLNHPQGQAKFLETSIRRNVPKMAPFIAGKVKAAGGR